MKNPTHSLAIHVLLDASGSMRSRKSQAIAAFNGFVDAMNASPNPGIVTVSQFGLVRKDLITERPIYEVPRLNADDYQPKGGTPMYSCIVENVERLANVSARAKVLIIIGDGVADLGGQHTLVDAKKSIALIEAQGGVAVFLAIGESAARQAALLGLPKARVVQCDNDIALAMRKMAVAITKQATPSAARTKVKVKAKAEA